MSKQVPTNEGLPAIVGAPMTKQADTDTEDNKLRSAEEGYDRSLLLGEGQNE